MSHPSRPSRLYDSTILIAHLRGDDRATESLLDTGDSPAYASVVSRVEIEGGMRSGERDGVARLFEGIELLPATDAVARRAGAELRRFRQSHTGIDIADYLIAATALEAGFELVTLNVRHFPMFEGLQAPW